MTDQHPALARAAKFCEAYSLRVPILMAPMAGACPASLAIAVANAGGLGGCGALLMQPDAIKAWASQVRAGSNGGFQLNLWIPDPPPERNAAAEDAVRAFLHQWGPEVAREAGDATPPDFAAQCEAMLEAGPAIISSIMGLYPPDFVARMKARGIRWFANATTVAEAMAAQDAGADVIVAQGMEAGGHRGAFDATKAEVRPGRPLCAAAGHCRRGEGAGGRDGRHRRCAWRGRGPAARGLGRADRHRVPALPGGEAARGLGRRHRPCAARRHHGEPRLLRPSGAQHRHGLRPRRGRARRTLAGSLSGAARPHAGHARCGDQGNDIDRMQAWAGQSARMAPAEPAGESCASCGMAPRRCCDRSPDVGRYLSSHTSSKRQLL